MSITYLFAAGFGFFGKTTVAELPDGDMVTPVGVFALVLAGAVALAFESDGVAEFAFTSVVFALESAVSLFKFVSAGASGLLFKTEILPVKAGIARNKADNIKVVAAAIVTFDSTVAVPRGLKAELDTLLVNNAPASVFPGCSKTAATRTRHERKNIAYKI